MMTSLPFVLCILLLGLSGVCIVAGDATKCLKLPGRCEGGTDLNSKGNGVVDFDACIDKCTVASATDITWYPDYYVDGGGNKFHTCLCWGGCPTQVSDGTVSSGSLTECAAAAAGGDPHLIGARGTPFDFNGRLGIPYCLLSDRSLHINALLGGGHDYDVSKKILSWMRELALFWLDSREKTHKAVLTSRRGKDASRGDLGFISTLTVDGVSLDLPLQPGESVTGSGGFKLTLVSNNSTLKGGVESDRYQLELEGVLQADISVNAEVEKMRSANDAEVHFNLKINSFQVTPSIHGILGQTFRPGMERAARAAQYKMLSKLLGTPVAVDGESGAGFLDGSTSDYETSTLVSTDCKFAQGPWVYAG